MKTLNKQFLTIASAVVKTRLFQIEKLKIFGALCKKINDH